MRTLPWKICLLALVAAVNAPALAERCVCDAEASCPGGMKRSTGMVSEPCNTDALFKRGNSELCAGPVRLSCQYTETTPAPQKRELGALTHEYDVKVVCDAKKGVLQMAGRVSAMSDALAGRGMTAGCDGEPRTFDVSAVNPERGLGELSSAQEELDIHAGKKPGGTSGGPSHLLVPPKPAPSSRLP